jgi:DNA polymerase
MTAEEKNQLAMTLDLADDYLRDGFRRDRGEYAFTGDLPRAETSAGPETAAAETFINRAETPAVSGMSGDDSLEALEAEILNCGACPLHTSRSRAIPGKGAERPLVLIAACAPGPDDEDAGRPFAGAAGDLLDKMLAPIALFRGTNCFLTHRVKCRPPADRPPRAEEIAACAPFLRRETALLKPRAILDFGRPLSAAPGSAESSAEAEDFPGIPVFSVHHPALILRDETLKRPAWISLKALGAALEAGPRAALSGLDRDHAESLRAAGRG